MNFLHLVALDTLLQAGLLSCACIDRDFCSAGDRVLSIAAATALLLMTLVIGMGRRGRLLAARRV
jgi:hypothetical protein